MVKKNKIKSVPISLLLRDAAVKAQPNGQAYVSEDGYSRFHTVKLLLPLPFSNSLLSHNSSDHCSARNIQKKAAMTLTSSMHLLDSCRCVNNTSCVSFTNSWETTENTRLWKQ